MDYEPGQVSNVLPDLVREAGQAARVAALKACWRQWRSLGALTGGPELHESEHQSNKGSPIVDPEALVLLSLQVRDDERRLDDFLGWIASVGAPLLSVQRMQNLARHFPERTGIRLGAFARLAAEAGDRRWRRHWRGAIDFELAPRAGKGAEHLALHMPAALVLRLRAGFGVGTKADLLAFLLGLAGRRVTVREAAEALGYSEVALRTAAQEMVLAGFVREVPGRPARYEADTEAWVQLLAYDEADDANDSLTWQHWAGTFAFLAAVLTWVQAGREAAWSPYVWSSRARDLCELHRRALDAARFRLPDEARYRGSAYLSAFAEAMQEVAERCNESA